MNVEQLRHILRAAAAITGEKDFEYIRELLKHRLINRGKLNGLIESEKDDSLKQILSRNWTITTSLNQ